MHKSLIILLAILATTLSASKLQNYISTDKNISLEHVKLLVKNGENVNGDKEDLNSGAPLHFAVYHNEYKITKYLLENGANPYLRNYKGYDSFYLGKKYPKILALLETYKQKVRMTYDEELNAPYGLNVDFKYYTNLEEAMKKSSQVDKPIFTFVGRENCKYCKILKKNALSDKRVLSSLEKDFVVLVLDANKRVPNKYYTPGVPAMWFLSSDGEPMFQAIVGAREANDLLNAFGVVKTTYSKK